MSAPAGMILNDGQIILTQSSSILSLEFEATTFLFGQVAQANSLSNKYQALDNVMFNPEGALNFKSAGVDIVYFLTTEDKIIFKEIAPP